MFLSVKQKYRSLVCGLLVIALGAYLLFRDWSGSRYIGTLDIITASHNLVWSELEQSRRINILTSKLMRRKLKEDVEDKFFVLDTKITKKQTQLQIPQYFKQKVSERLSRVPFDPRFTLAAYYTYLIQFKRPLEDLEVPFHWSDWIDMSTLEKVIYLSSSNITCDYFDHRQYQNITFTQKGKTSDTQKGAIDPREFCVDVPKKSGKFELGYNITHCGGRMIKEKAVMAALSYVHTLFPNPETILFLTKDGSYNVRVARKKQSIVSGNEIGQFITQLSQTDQSINTLEAFQKLQKVRPAEKQNIFTDYEVRLKHEDFVIDPSLSLLELYRKESERPLSRQTKNFQRALTTSLALKKDRPKYFFEPRIYDTSAGDHYDWRFFSGFHKNRQDSLIVLHRLTRSWLSFTRKLGLNTWIAHGSLLSWHFNGLAFPWDDDIDVQMPIQDLLKLSERFNQSIIVEDAEEGFGRFFLDCGTYVASREHGNGDNNIDARFIDIDSGLYIDITALAVSNEEAKSFKSLIPDKVKHVFTNNKDMNNYLQVYNCRNKHFASLKELSPLVRTFYDGELAYVPRNYPTILRKEYGEGVTRRLYKGKVYLGQLRIWVHQNPLIVFLRNPNEWDLYFKDKSHLGIKSLPSAKGDLSVNELNELQNLSEVNLFRLLNHDEILLQYQVSHGFTLFHEAEGMRLQMEKSTEVMMDRAPDLPPLYYEPFLFRMRKAYTTFEANVERYEKLANKTQ